MGLEAATYIEDLVATNPTSSDDLDQGDNHVRLIKDVLQKSFPNLGANAVTSTALELSLLTGCTRSASEIEDIAVRGGANTFSDTNTFSGTLNVTGTTKFKGKAELARGQYGLGSLASNVNISSVTPFGNAVLFNTAITIPAGSYGVISASTSAGVPLIGVISTPNSSQIAVSVYTTAGAVSNANTAVINFVFYE
jgi:hypothetical protein